MTNKLVYTHLDNGIHKFYWGGAELEIVTEYVKLFISIHTTLVPNSTMLILHDYQNTVTPSLNIVANILKTYKVRDDIFLRIAYLYSDTLFPIIMGNVNTFAPSNTIRQFFKADEEQQAIDWLLTEPDSEIGKVMSDRLVYTQLENKIHQFYWGDTALETITEYTVLFKKLHEDSPPNSTMRILHDYRETGTPSFNVIANIMKGYKIRDDVTLRVAHLYSDSIYPMIMKNATMVARFDASRQFFKVNEKAQAIEWLLENKPIE